MENLRVPLRVVFYKDEEDWIAHCLEFDLMGDGKNKQDALDRLIAAVNLQVESSVESDNPRNLFKPADGRIFAMFAAGKDVTVGDLRLTFGSVTIDAAEAREYVEIDAGDLKLACTS